MSQCWSEGALRAYLDRELPPEDMNLAAAHLGDCTVCDGLCTELAARAAHVSALVEMLGEPEDVKWPQTLPPRIAARTATRWQWAGAALALAAGLALAALILPKSDVRQPAGPSPPAPPAVAVNTVEPEVVAPDKERPARPVPTRARSVRRATPGMDYFLALDDEPIESGVVMRVGVNPGNLQADIVFGPDGRAHAIRLVSGKY
jgi:anti-sigma factor RsiW